jgi:hypothetical protein
MFSDGATYLGMRDGGMLVGTRVSEKGPSSLTPQQLHMEHMAHSDRGLLKTAADNKQHAQMESDPSGLVHAGEKRHRSMGVASPSETWEIIQKVEELATQLLSDATSHGEQQFQTDGVQMSELDTFNTLLSKLKGRLDMQQNTTGH